jgi:hypothetical protein
MRHEYIKDEKIDRSIIMMSRNCELCSKVFSTPGNKRRHDQLFHKMDSKTAHETELAVDFYNQQYPPNAHADEKEEMEETDEDEEDDHESEDSHDDDEKHGSLGNHDDPDEPVWHALLKTIPNVKREDLLKRIVCDEWLEKLRKWIWVRMNFVDEFKNTELYDNLENTKEGFENNMHLDEEEAWNAAWAARRPTLMKYVQRFVKSNDFTDMGTDTDEENYSDDAVIV